MNITEEILEQYSKKPEPRAKTVIEPFLSENGSVLPNKFACWPHPMDKISKLDE